MVAPPRLKVSEQEYLMFERTHEWKHEYYQGVVTAMPAVNVDHVQIVGNTAVSLGQQLRGRARVLMSMMRVKVGANGLYAYPDVIVVYGRPELADDYQDTLLNPTVIVEVYSPASEAYDRGKKFGHYRTLESLREYVLIAQDMPLVEHFVRQEDGTWRFAAASGLAESIHLPTVDCTLALADVYDLIEWEKAASERRPLILT